MQDTAEWLLAIDPEDRDALRHCGHRLAGTLGSFGFLDAADLARALEHACSESAQQVHDAVAALVDALRDLAR